MRKPYFLLLLLRYRFPKTMRALFFRRTTPTEQIDHVATQQLHIAVGETLGLCFLSNARANRLTRDSSKHPTKVSDA